MARDRGRIAAHDAADLARAPFRWRSKEWLRFGEGVGVVAVVYASDGPLYRAVQRNRSRATDDYARFITHFGGGVGEDISFALIAAGLGTKNDSIIETGFDALEAQVWAAGLITPAIKRVAGRARPIQDQGTHSFHDFNSRYQSFPSGHATNAFALASVLADRYDGWLIPTLAYTAATSVAFARVNDRAHFPSDVLAGALIGRAVGRSIVERHHARGGAPATVTIMPMGGAHGGGIRIAATF